MQYGIYYVDPTPVGDGSGDTNCRVFLGSSNAPGYDQQAGEGDNFTITRDEELAYGSLDAAILAYMRCCYPDNAPAHERRLRRIQRRERRLSNDAEHLILDLLARCGPRVSYYPQMDKDGCVEYPVSLFFYGKYKNPSISITDVHLTGNILCADGIDEATGKKECDLPLYPEHYTLALEFVAIALGIERQSAFGKLVTGIRARIAGLLRAVKDRTDSFTRHLRLCAALRRARKCPDYDSARKAIEQAGFSVSDYGQYHNDPLKAYAYFTADGRRDNPHGIFIVYAFRQTGVSAYRADKILSIEKR